jgi:hypothetical protein
LTQSPWLKVNQVAADRPGARVTVTSSEPAEPASIARVVAIDRPEDASTVIEGLSL